MPSKDQNFEHWAGNARTLKFGPVLDQNGQTVNLFGCTATWAMAKKNTSPLTDVIVEKSTAVPSEMTIAEESLGFYLFVYLMKNDTKDIKQASYYHEATIIDASGKPDTVSIGKVTLYQTLISETIG